MNLDDKSMSNTWTPNWSGWYDTSTKGLKSVCEGIYSHFTTEKTQQVGLETMKQLPDPTTTSYKGIAKILLIPVIFFALYKITCFFYASLGKSVAKTFQTKTPDVGFTLNDISSEDIKKFEQAMKGANRSESDYEKAKEAIIKFAKMGFEDAICYTSAIDKNSSEIEMKNITVRPNYLREYVEQGELIVNDNSYKADFYTELARVFDLLGNPKAKKILLEKAAILCNPQTVVKVAAAYRVINYVKDDPILANLAKIENEYNLYECVKSDRGMLMIFLTDEQQAGIAYYHLARYYTLNNDANKAFVMYAKAAPHHFISALHVADAYENSKNELYEGYDAVYYVYAAKLLETELGSWKCHLAKFPNISTLSKVIAGCERAIKAYSKPDQSEKKSEAETLKTYLETKQTAYLKEIKE